VHREDENTIAELRDVLGQFKHQLALAEGGQAPGQPPRVPPRQFMSVQEAAHREQIHRD
jgi:hypothetical protein